MSGFAARVLVAIAIVAAGTALGACGGGGTGGKSPEAGRFTSLGCASCHTLKAVGASGRVGPNLDELEPDAATVARQLRTGGPGMPSFAGKLSAAELRSLAAWVARAAATG